MNYGIRFSIVVLAGIAAVFLAIPLISGFQTLDITAVQRGFRGVAMGLVYHNPEEKALEAANKIPGYLPQLPPVGPKAGTVYKNVKVLGDLSVGQFTRLMASITQWVAPTQGCNYCHNPNNMAEDSVYTKVVARRMIQMTQTINQNWTTHVAATGVTCYTCHRGNPVPSQIWFNDAGHPMASGAAQAYTGQNEPSKAAGYTSLATDPFTPFLENAAPIRVQSMTALPTGNLSSIKQTDWTYALMMHMSNALGVNCTYCHNSRAFENWAESSPQRVTAWYGIRMVRQINDDYMASLTGVFPATRLGPKGDVAKTNCATCHQGVYKPLYGVSMAKDFPELQKVSASAK